MSARVSQIEDEHGNRIPSLLTSSEGTWTSGPAQTRHRLHTRLRHLTTGRLIDRIFAENERVPVAPLETRRVTYSYARDDAQFFIDIETFDEFEFSNEQLGERRLAGSSTSSCRRKYRSRWWTPLRPVVAA